MIDHQFYPTPEELAVKAWSLFKNKNVRYILEPSAGRADLLEPCKSRHSFSSSYSYDIDCIESMPDNIAVLKSKGLRVIDTDFLSFQTNKLYDRIILNPPFNQGVNHALKAWDILKNGEMVAILNAASIESPNTKDRQYLVDLIKAHGSVEYIESAFMTTDTQRHTKVRVALIHLTKVTHSEKLFSLDDMGLYKDNTPEAIGEQEDALFHKDLAIPNSTIKNSVIAFNSAAKAIKESVKADAAAKYYKSLVCSRLSTDFSDSSSQRSFNEQYEELKLAAWGSIINATEFTSRFSKNVVKDLKKDLESITEMEFSERNVLGLLEGLLLNKAKLDDQMLLDTFDLITAYHSNNRFVYRSYTQSGWKSNDKHRSRSFRMKHTRFILPARSGCSISFGYEGKQMLGDFDKTFALLDGKQAPEISLISLFIDDDSFKQLIQGERLEASYFSCRYYAGIDSIHFFPTKKGKELIDRLNRTVGKLRNWLPNEDTVSPEFWEQYDKAEKITAVLEANPEYTKIRDYEFNHANASIDAFHDKACEQLNIPIFGRLEHAKPANGHQRQLELLAS